MIESESIESCSIQSEVKTEASRAEKRTRLVVMLTALMMVVELVFGTLSHSMSLLADGWHMATHVGALGISTLAYWFARTRAQASSFAFGTGKMNALAGYTSAGLLLMVSLGMVFESVQRFVNPVAVIYAEAIPVAALGLLLNIVSAFLLQTDHDHTGHDHADHDHKHHDHNLASAYFHVLADALTSVLALVALFAGRNFGLLWMDPLVAIIGGLVVGKWGIGLMLHAGKDLVDANVPVGIREKIKGSLESIEGTQIKDLHVWKVGNSLLCMVTVFSSTSMHSTELKALVLKVAPISHLTIEVVHT
jgi:cation diffusion facilitator family transporter